MVVGREPHIFSVSSCGEKISSDFGPVTRGVVEILDLSTARPECNLVTVGANTDTEVILPAPLIRVSRGSAEPRRSTMCPRTSPYPVERVGRDAWFERLGVFDEHVEAAETRDRKVGNAHT